MLVSDGHPAPLPQFWHTPIICNKEGKKLSKRDFGFSLDDLRSTGFVHEAIVNYLALIGGKAAEQEIMSLEELIATIDFATYSTSDTIRYDEDKLRWINHAWIKRLPTAIVAERCRPLLEALYPAAADLPAATLTKIIAPLQPELATLADCVPLLHGYFHEPELDRESLDRFGLAKCHAALTEIANELAGSKTVSEQQQQMKEIGKRYGIGTKELFTLVRLITTGSAEGTSITNILEIIPQDRIIARIRQALQS